MKQEHRRERARHEVRVSKAAMASPSYWLWFAVALVLIAMVGGR
jgi:hypothetical protein